eukprot:gene15939-22071_t
MIPPLASLVKYDNPVLVGSSKGGKGAKGMMGKKGSLPPVEQKPGLTQTEDILNSILPPREWTEEGQLWVPEWTEEGQLWVQYVSSTPATRLDVINLQEKLDQQLQQRQARETGICPVREELYSQCFDELIREVTINCAERGLLLLRVRDEMRMTIAAYQTLYESAVAFGMRKALQTEQGKNEMETKIQTLEGDVKDLERQVQEWKLKCEAIEKRENERRETEGKKHKEEVTYLENYAKQLKQQLEQFLVPSKKPAAAPAAPAGKAQNWKECYTAAFPDQPTAPELIPAATAFSYSATCIVDVRVDGHLFRFRSFNRLSRKMFTHN